MMTNSTQYQDSRQAQAEPAQAASQPLEVEERLRQAERRIEALTQELCEARQYKNEFLLSMSHELRTPLNAMIGYTSLTISALQPHIAPEHLENLRKAERSARALLQLINDILDFSKIQAGKVQLQIEDVELRDAIEDAMIAAEALIGEKPVELRQEIADDAPLVQSDYAKLKQILDNLVNNAAKFTAEGSVTVRARLHEGGHAVRIEIEDTGEGIPDQKIGVIFELFKQGDNSTKKKFRGTGLGLAITKSYCEMLRIEIGLRSQVGKGTLFWLTVPLNAADESPSILSVISPHAGNAHIVVPPDFQERVFSSVLIVDDDEMNLDLHRSIFQQANRTVHLARSGKECLAVTGQVAPDVILMDLGMPGMDGLETTRYLKENAATAAIPVIACSAYAARDIQEKVFAAGCIGYISKPVDPQRLAQQVAWIIHSTQAKQQS